MCVPALFPPVPAIGLRPSGLLKGFRGSLPPCPLHMQQQAGLGCDGHGVEIGSSDLCESTPVARPSLRPLPHPPFRQAPCAPARVPPPPRSGAPGFVHEGRAKSSFFSGCANKKWYERGEPAPNRRTGILAVAFALVGWGGPGLCVRESTSNQAGVVSGSLTGRLGAGRASGLQGSFSPSSEVVWEPHSQPRRLAWVGCLSEHVRTRSLSRTRPWHLLSNAQKSWMSASKL